jgi:hypothetical protein
MLRRMGYCVRVNTCLRVHARVRLHRLDCEIKQPNNQTNRAGGGLCR